MLGNFKNKKVLGFIAIIIVVIIWGCAFTVKPILLVKYDPLQIVFLQTFFAFFIIGLLCVYKKHLFRIGKEMICRIMLSGILGIAIYQFLLNYSIGLIGSTVPSIFSGLIPAMCILADFIIFKRPIKLLEIMSIILSFFGIVLITQITEISEVKLLPYLLLFISNVVWIYYCYFNNFPRDNIPDLVLLFYQLLGCILLLIPYVIISDFPWVALLTLEILGSALFLSVVNGVFAYILFIYSLKVLNVLYTNIAINLVPIVTIIANYIVFREGMTMMQVLETSLVILAVLLPNIKFEKNREEVK